MTTNCNHKPSYKFYIPTTFPDSHDVEFFKGFGGRYLDPQGTFRMFWEHLEDNI